MELYRYKNNITGSLTVTSDGEAISFDGMTAKVCAVCPQGQQLLDITISDNTIYYTYPASRQRYVGVFCIVLEMYADGKIQNTLEWEDVFEIREHVDVNETSLSLTGDVGVGIEKLLEIVERLEGEIDELTYEVEDEVLKIRRAASVDETEELLTLTGGSVKMNEEEEVLTLV